MNVNKHVISVKCRSLSRVQAPDTALGDAVTLTSSGLHQLATATICMRIPLTCRKGSDNTSINDQDA